MEPKSSWWGTFLVVQWLRTCLVKQAMRVPSPVCELRFPHAWEQLSPHATTGVHVLQQNIPHAATETRRVQILKKEKNSWLNSVRQGKLSRSWHVVST